MSLDYHHMSANENKWFKNVMSTFKIYSLYTEALKYVYTSVYTAETYSSRRLPAVDVLNINPNSSNN